MAFVKLDCGMLNSTLWIDREGRELFITALLMAEPYELTTPTPQLQTRSLEPTGFLIPVGWYGFVPAAGSGIIRRSGMTHEDGYLALERLAQPDAESRSPEFEGRRLVRIDGGYLILNYDKYRQKDHTAAERSKRYRARKMSRVANVTSRVASRSVTQEEVEVEVEGRRRRRESKPNPSCASSMRVSDNFALFWTAYPKKRSKGAALKAWTALRPDAALVAAILVGVRRAVASPDWQRDRGQYIPHPATWLRARGWEDEPDQVPVTGIDAWLAEQQAQGER